MRSPLLDRPGAVEADAPDTGVAAHYGDPLREQRAAATAAAYVDRSNRGVVTVSGPDRLSWLHSLTTQHLTELGADAPTDALVLSPNGHVEHHLRVVDDGTTTWLDVEPGTAEALVGFLRSMQFLLRVEVTDVSDEWAVVTLLGPGWSATPALPDEGRTLTLGGVEVVAHRRPAATDLLVPRGDVPAVVAALDDADAVPAGMDAYEALRIAAGEPRLHRDTDHRTIPHEVGWLSGAVHLDKGCYRGQETVARVHNLGRPPRRLVLLHLDGSAEELPAVGSDVTADGRAVGRVGTARHHFELGPVALAVVKRTVADDSEVVAGGPEVAVAARVEGLATVPSEAGDRRERPRLMSF